MRSLLGRCEAERNQPEHCTGSVITLMEEKKTGKPKKGETQKYGFTIRFMQMTRFIERYVPYDDHSITHPSAFWMSQCSPAITPATTTTTNTTTTTRHSQLLLCGQSEKIVIVIRIQRAVQASFLHFFLSNHHLLTLAGSTAAGTLSCTHMDTCVLSVPR